MGCLMDPHIFDSAKDIYKYSSEGCLLEKSRYKSNGKLWRKYTFNYDEKGTLIERIRYDNEIMIPKELTEYIITYR